MTFTLGDAIEETLKKWEIDEVPRDQRRKRFAGDVMRTYNRMQPQKTAVKKTTLDGFI
jgi:hypothetical protein